jgi:hypothetical protein
MLWSVTLGGKWQLMINQPISKAIEEVLDIARWAPSGDNAQPWTFRIKGDREVEVIVRRTNPNIYEYRGGEPTLISVGALIENIRIAAPAFGLKVIWHYSGSADGLDRIALHFADAEVISSPDLFNEIRIRSVDRRRFRMRALTTEQKSQLSEALTPNLRVEWFETLSDRRRMAGLSALSTNIRLTIPEAFEVHRSIVDWENSESERAVPSRALGLDPITLKITRWSMGSWRRTKFMNALGASNFASVQMDFLPGLCSGAYFAIRLERSSTHSNDAVTQKIQAGQSIQRFKKEVLYKSKGRQLS